MMLMSEDTGHFKAEEYITDSKKYESHDSLNILITVDVSHRHLIPFVLRPPILFVLRYDQFAEMIAGSLPS